MDPRWLANRVPAWILVAVVAVGVLAGGWWVAAAPEDVPTATADHPSEPPFPETLNDSVSIMLSRGVCYGDCPVYKVLICGDGTVHYTGNLFVKVKGYVQYSISKRDVRRLLVEAYEIDFFALERRYSSGLTDVAYVETSIALPGTSKTVTSEASPDRLSRFEDRIDEVAMTRFLVENQSIIPNSIAAEPVAEAPSGCE